MAQWSEMRERGAAWGVPFVVGVYQTLGRTPCRIMLAPIVMWFYVFGGAQRRASQDYLTRAWKAGHLKRKPGFWSGYRHFLTFSFAMLDKMVAWMGKIRASDVEGVNDGLFDAAKKSGRGAIVLTAHMGNPEVVRAIATVAGRFRVNVLMHTAHAENFNRILNRVSPDSPVRLVQVTEIDMGVAMRLSEAVQQGEWVVMTGDRVAVRGGEESAAPAMFLGEEALFPTGPYVLASALKCPAFTLFCLQKPNGRYGIMFEPFDDPVRLPRGQRREALAGYVRTYVQRLEAAVAVAPFQWFNFYDYWARPDRVAPKDGPKDATT